MNYMAVAFTTLVLEPPFQHAGGHCWYARLPPELSEASDREGGERRSPWRLLEDGIPVGTPHVEHKEIADQGRGRYSHWDVLYFSTSDNTDPNGNGREYALTLTAPEVIETRPAAEPGLVPQSEGPEAKRLVLKPPFAHEGGHCWLARLPDWLLEETDTIEAPARSRWRLRENGIVVGAPHAEHKDVKLLGRGRYSHWHKLYFSASDNTDPNQNGRAYELVWRAEGSRDAELMDGIGSLVSAYLRQPVECTGAEVRHRDKSALRGRQYGKYTFRPAPDTSLVSPGASADQTVFARWAEDSRIQEALEYHLASRRFTSFELPEFIGSTRILDGVVGVWSYLPEIDFEDGGVWSREQLQRVVRVIAEISSVTVDEVQHLSEVDVGPVWAKPIAAETAELLHRLLTATEVPPLPPPFDRRKLGEMYWDVVRFLEIEPAALARFGSLEPRYLSHNSAESSNFIALPGRERVIVCDWEIASFNAAGASLSFLAELGPEVRDAMAGYYVSCLRDYGIIVDLCDVQFVIPCVETFYWLRDGTAHATREGSLGRGLEYIEKGLTYLEQLLAVLN